MLARPQIKINSMATLNPIDATKDNLIEFEVNGGDQVVGNKITIYKDGTIVFEETVTNFEFNHTIPANTLANGQEYTVTIQTENVDNELSEASDIVSLKCYSEIILNITNITNDGKIKNQNEIFKATYSQAESAILNGYIWKFYDASKNLLYSSGELFDGKLEYATTGWNNNETYYVECIVITIDNYEKSTGLIQFVAQYLQPKINSVIDLKNNKNTGSIEVTSHVVQILGKTKNEPPIYINNEEIDLTDNILTFDINFFFSNKDWTIQLWLRDLDDNEEFMKIDMKDYTMIFKYGNNMVICDKVLDDNTIMSHYCSNELEITKTDKIVLNIQCVNNRLNLTIMLNN